MVFRRRLEIGNKGGKENAELAMLRSKDKNTNATVYKYNSLQIRCHYFEKATYIYRLVKFLLSVHRFFHRIDVSLCSQETF